MARGNPKNIRAISDFARKDITIVNRESGAGCRLMLDHHLAQLGIASKSVRGYGQIALGHLPAAWHVLTGKAIVASRQKPPPSPLGWPSFRC